MIVKTSAFCKKILTSNLQAASGIAGPMNGNYIRLYKTQVALTSGLTYLDFTESTYTGYEGVGPITWSSAINETDGSESVISSSSTFLASGAVDVAESAFGYYVQQGSSGSSALLYAEEFDEPVSFTNQGDGVVVVLKYNETTGAGQSVASVIR